MNKTKTDTIPNLDKKPTDKPQVNLQHREGNGEFLIIHLLTHVCNKLDVIMNHTQTQVEILQKIEVHQRKQLTALTTHFDNQRKIIELLGGKKDEVGDI